MRLKRGELSAWVTAPPRLFVIETPSVEAVDLGCSYTLKVDDHGDTHLRVTRGWVALERDGPDGMVPAGWSCVTARGKVGTPVREDAPEPVKNAFASFDFTPSEKTLDAVLKQSRAEDALGLWHLLSRTEGVARNRVFNRLSAMVPAPTGCQPSSILRLRPDSLERWREAIMRKGRKEMVLPFGLGRIPNPNELEEN
jgi:hypothetical protein